MSKVTNYYIVTEPYVEGLIAEVNDLINEGWQPIGTPIKITVEDIDILAQTMVKYSQI